MNDLICPDLTDRRSLILIELQSPLKNGNYESISSHYFCCYVFAGLFLFTSCNKCSTHRGEGRGCFKGWFPWRSPLPGVFLISRAIST